MLKSLRLLGATIVLFAPVLCGAQTSNSTADKPATDFKTAPTPLDIMQLMSTYMGGDVTPEQIFDMGVKSNMRIPMQHLRVKFTDLRTETEMTREDIANILGQSRQDGAHDLIVRTLGAFAFPGIEADQLIDLFDAAALASMRMPPKYIDIEFYDARLGSTNLANGGISGSVPTRVYSPTEAVETQQDASEPGLADDWEDTTVVDFFVANDRVFQSKNGLEFVMPYSSVAKDVKDLNQRVRKEVEMLLQIETDLDIAFVHTEAPFFAQAAVGTEGNMRRYIALLHLKASTKDKANEMREMYPKLYAR